MHRILALAAFFAGIALQPTVAGAQSPPPTKLVWQRTPTIDDVRRVYPPAAFAKGAIGGAMIGCDVAPDGALLHCKAFAEEPANMGFGDAAVNLAAYFKLQPGTFEHSLPVPGRIAMPMVFGMPNRPMPKLNFRLGDTAMLLTNIDFHRDASAPTHLGCITAEPPHRCEIHFITWTARPNAMSALASTLSTGADHGADVLICWVKPDGALTDCQASGKPGRQIVDELGAAFKAPRFADDRAAVGAGPIMIALNWTPLNAAALALKGDAPAVAPAKTEP